MQTGTMQHMNANHGYFPGLGKGWLAVLLLLFLGGMSSSQAAPAPAQLLEVEAGTHVLVRETGGVRRVAVGDPNVADVNVINGRELLITGKKQGLTSLMVWPRSASLPKEYRIRVGAIKDPTKALKPDPELAGATIEPGASLEGKLPNLLAYRRAQQAAQRPTDAPVDFSQVEGDFQVLTEIKIAEVNRTTAKRYGLNLNYSHTGSDGTIAVGTGFDLVSNAFSLAFDRVIGSNESIGGILNMLEQRGVVRVLAEPSLTAMSGQTASFLAGGEFPVPVNQSGTGSSGSVTVEYKEFGVRLALTPTVLSKDRIALKVAPEVSDLDFTAGIQIGGVAVPALTVRRTETSIELGDGESFVISGLVSNNLTANVDKVPGLGDIPILGAFFKSVTYDRSERELIMVVTPHLVRPIAREAKLPPLPGVKYDQYRPGFGQIIFTESGDFDSGATGFSN